MNGTTHNHDMRDKLVSNLEAVIKDAEELLKNTGQQVGDGYQFAKERFETSLQSAKAGLGKMEDSLVTHSKEALHSTDKYVQAHPWQSVGVGLFAGLVLGLLLGRK